MSRLYLFLHLWRVFGFTTARDFWLLRCPRCHGRHNPTKRCVI